MREVSLRERALRLLARREHSRLELQRKLAPHAEDPAALKALLDELEGKNQLSERRFAEARAHMLARKYGAARIEQDLRARGIAAEAAEAAAAEARSSEFERAREVWRRKFGQPAANLKERARQARFLQSRGFRPEVIQRILRMEDE